MSTLIRISWFIGAIVTDLVHRDIPSPARLVDKIGRIRSTWWMTGLVPAEMRP
jgi:hypothetical protein